ncbi:hypothetical protein B0A50_07492 [Salinomyces thailandicus]|uniref:Dystroglycan-type cadherin-like domain-containing protein n=1 Tax=Salinomyces thailandicus TaxID=706561 RepID=A0A4U0TNY8_9PEZI|nr:hypothetical protein B0A50_07492 [Salinomyces thailandica]
MPCTLIVSSDPAPQLEGDISQQLAATANLSSSQPPVVTILPSETFKFNFRPSSFIDIVQRQLYYYATLTNHTPLPSWLSFDGKELAFSGIAPTLSALPQSWDIDLIASDVEGFAGATAAFTIAIATQQLVFVPAEQTVDISSGRDVTFDLLQHELFRNGQAADINDLAQTRTSALPSWLTFDASTLALSGVVPDDATDETVSITVTDMLAYSATAIVNLKGSDSKNSVFHGTVGVLTANPGQTFTYRFPDSLFTTPDPIITITLPSSARWLHFDAASRELQGTVPSNTSPASITATLTAKSSVSSEGQSQDFAINIKAADTHASTSTPLATRASPKNTSTPWPAPVKSSSGSRLSGGVIAAIAILSVLAAVFLIVCLFLCARRRRRDGYERHSASPTKRNISRPIIQPDSDSILVTTELQRDVEKDAGVQALESRQDELPPQIALDLPSQNEGRKSKWYKRFSRISQASSIGRGEDAIRADDNIPEWGVDPAALHTPHDSFSVPTEMARVTRAPSQSSPTKRAMRRLRDKRQSRLSVGLGIDTDIIGVLPRHSSRNDRKHRRDASSLGFTLAKDRSSQASLSTRGTSVLSTRPSDFPRPPTGSTMSMSRSIPTLALTEAERHKSIRLVGRSDSIADNRSLQDKRTSFIRNRASTSFQSPLFAHGSRVPSSKQSGQTSTAASSAGSLRKSRGGKSLLASYSESSSLEPQGHESKRFSQRVRSAFAPGFPKTLTQSSLGADEGGAGDNEESSSAYYTTEGSSSEDLQAQLALPRHQRSWVLPGEASPTPPPAPPASRQLSSARRSASVASNSTDAPRQKWKDRVREQRSSSPLATAVAVPIPERSPLRLRSKAEARKSQLSEPMSLVSNDSISRARIERPRLVHTNSKRPVSVEEAKRLSSLRAESGVDTDAQAGSEMWEDTEAEVEGAGLMPPALQSRSQASTQRSNVSGPAFL